MGRYAGSNKIVPASVGWILGHAGDYIHIRVVGGPDKKGRYSIRVLPKGKTLKIAGNKIILDNPTNRKD